MKPDTIVTLKHSRRLAGRSYASSERFLVTSLSGSSAHLLALSDPSAPELECPLKDLVAVGEAIQPHDRATRLHEAIHDRLSSL